MNNSAAKVGEIFTEAGAAFNKLAEMTMMLHPIAESPAGSKWTEEEIEMLRSCVHSFAEDLNKLSQHIRSRTVVQIRTTLKKKAFEEAGIPVRQITMSSGQVAHTQSAPASSTPASAPPTPATLSSHQAPQHSGQSILGKSAEVTLNMLNAPESEVDVEGLGSEVKLEFEAGSEEVTT